MRIKESDPTQMIMLKCLIWLNSFKWVVSTLAVFLAMMVTMEAHAQGITLTVTHNDDVVDASGCTAAHCSLREAVNSANISGRPHTIDIPQGTGVITLTGGQIEITASQYLEILGNEITTDLIIEAGGWGGARHFEIGADANVMLHALELTGGSADKGGSILNHGSLRLSTTAVTSNVAATSGNFGDGGGIYNAEGAFLGISNLSSVCNNEANFGGGIYNDGGTVSLWRANICSNKAIGHPESNGGGIRNWKGGKVLIRSVVTTVVDNIATKRGGGVHNAGAGSELVVEDAFIEGNSAESGAGVWSDGNAAIQRAKFLSNSGSGFGEGKGAGLFNAGELEIINTTFYKNSNIESGGAISNQGSAKISHVTAYDNIAAIGSSIESSAGAVDFTHSFAGGSLGDECSFANTAVTYTSINFATDSSCGQFAIETAPQFGELDSRKNLPLLSTSPLIDAGDPCFCVSEDQRGYARSIDGPDTDTIAQCDIGAYEFGSSRDAIGQNDCDDELCMPIKTAKSKVAMICL